MCECLLHSRSGSQGKGVLCGPEQDKLEGELSPGVGEPPDAQGGRSHNGQLAEYFTHVKGTAGEKVPVMGPLENPQRHPESLKGLLNPRQAQQAQCQLLASKVIPAPSTTPSSNSGGFRNLGNELVREKNSPPAPLLPGQVAGPPQG